MLMPNNFFEIKKYATIAMDISFDRRCRRDFGNWLFDFGADIRLARR